MKSSALVVWAIAIEFLLLVNCSTTYAQPKSSSAAPSASNSHSTKPPATIGMESPIQRERLDLEKQKLASDRAAERERLNLERSKLEVERSKVVWSALSTIVPLLGVLLTVAYSAWSFTRQTALQIAAQNDAAKLAFEVKAAEIAFAGRSPQAVFNRGKALKAMFGSRLPDGFLAQFDPNIYGGDKEDPDVKKFFLELIVKHPDQKVQILKYWREIFPGDAAWLGRVNLE